MAQYRIYLPGGSGSGRSIECRTFVDLDKWSDWAQTVYEKRLIDIRNSDYPYSDEQIESFAHNFDKFYDQMKIFVQEKGTEWFHIPEYWDESPYRLPFEGTLFMLNNIATEYKIHSKQVSEEEFKQYTMDVLGDNCEISLPDQLKDILTLELCEEIIKSNYGMMVNPSLSDLIINWYNSDNKCTFFNSSSPVWGKINEQICKVWYETRFKPEFVDWVLNT